MKILQKSQFSPQSKSHLFDIFEVPGNALKCSVSKFVSNVEKEMFHKEFLSKITIFFFF